LAEGIERGILEFLVYPAEDGEDKIVEGQGGAPGFKPVVTTAGLYPGTRPVPLKLAQRDKL
jgi:hypothetical protein